MQERYPFLDPVTHKRIPEPPVKKETVIAPESAPYVWAEIIERNPVTEVVLAHYPPAPHGSSGRFETRVYPALNVLGYLRKGLWPKVALGQSELVAISSLVGTVSTGENPEEAQIISGLRFYGEEIIEPQNPHSFVTLDFEYPPSPERLENISYFLGHTINDWYLLESGNSYHLILDTLVLPETLPQHWAGLVRLFTDPKDPLAHVFEGFADDLYKNCDNPNKLKRLAREIRQFAGHVDEPGEGKPTHLIDLRHLSHSLEELVAFELNEDPFEVNGLGFLRISDSPRHNSPPILVAQKVEGEVTILVPLKDPFENPQLKLAI